MDNNNKDIEFTSNFTQKCDGTFFTRSVSDTEILFYDIYFSYKTKHIAVHLYFIQQQKNKYKKGPIRPWKRWSPSKQLILYNHTHFQSSK